MRSASTAAIFCSGIVRTAPSPSAIGSSCESVCCRGDPVGDRTGSSAPHQTELLPRSRLAGGAASADGCSRPATRGRPRGGERRSGRRRQRGAGGRCSSRRGRRACAGRRRRGEPRCPAGHAFLAADRKLRLYVTRRPRQAARVAVASGCGSTSGPQQPAQAQREIIASAGSASTALRGRRTRGIARAASAPAKTTPEPP
jgi:hypothetical protein